MPRDNHRTIRRPAIRVIGPSIAYLVLGNAPDKLILIDLADADELERYSWRLASIPNCEYATRTGCSNGHTETVFIHRQLMGLRKGDSLTVDHINLNSLDNRRVNLRLATRHQQSANRRMRTNNRTGVKGVSFNSKLGKYRAQLAITTNGKRKNYHLGDFTTIHEAAMAYAEKIKEVYGEFARI
jgi:AP2 domain/HNH endonuclease